MNEQEIFKAMYYRLFGKVCDVIEKAENFERAKKMLINATRETEEMYMKFEQ